MMEEDEFRYKFSKLVTRELEFGYLHQEVIPELEKEIIANNPVLASIYPKDAIKKKGWTRSLALANLRHWEKESLKGQAIKLMQGEIPATMFGRVLSVLKDAIREKKIDPAEFGLTLDDNGRIIPPIPRAKASEEPAPARIIRVDFRREHSGIIPPKTGIEASNEPVSAEITRVDFRQKRRIADCQPQPSAQAAPGISHLRNLLTSVVQATKLFSGGKR